MQKMTHSPKQQKNIEHFGSSNKARMQIKTKNKTYRKKSAAQLLVFRQKNKILANDKYFFSLMHFLIARILLMVHIKAKYFCFKFKGIPLVWSRLKTAKKNNKSVLK